MSALTRVHLHVFAFTYVSIMNLTNWHYIVYFGNSNYICFEITCLLKRHKLVNTIGVICIKDIESVLLRHSITIIHRY